MRIQFQDKKQAARFAAAVVNVTGREALLTRTETALWRVQSADLNSELAFAISSLLDSGLPSQQVTLDQVADQVEAQRWAAPGAQWVRETTGPATGWARGPGQHTVFRGARREEAAARY